MMVCGIDWLTSLVVGPGDVTPVGVEVTYRVPWGNVPAKKPVPPKTVEAEPQPSNNLL